MSGALSADLHIHTNASDGAFSADEVTQFALEAGLETIALTDHDCLSALDGLQPPDGIEVIPGAELSAYYNEREVHILGYFLDPEDEELVTVLKQLQQKRRARAFSIIRKLAERNVDIPASEVFKIAGGDSVSRLHVAELLIENGHSANLYEAFRDWLGPAGAAFVAKPHFTVAEAIEIIHRAGGAAVLAHPRSSFTPEEAGVFAAWGLDGVETQYPTHSTKDTQKWGSFCDEQGLVATGGSDFHGRRHLDTPIGAARVTRETVERLFERAGDNAVRRID
jgi:predicted metal-dependent phosphoesterase TrpH